MKTVDLVIRPDGTIESVHADSLVPFFNKMGSMTRSRASRVEPTEELSDEAIHSLMTQKVMPETGLDLGLAFLLFHFPAAWWADMTPSAGPVLGPFDLHQQAIEAELRWLHDNVFCERKDAHNDQDQAEGGTPAGAE